jgi:IS1 family transposase
MPSNSTTSSWLFPPQTQEVQFDEKWSFVGKKEKHCDRTDPDDDWFGDHWDHVAFDPEHRLVVSLVCGRRTNDHTQLLVEDFHDRTEGRLMNLMTSDENPAYAIAILETYGEEVIPERHGDRGRHPKPYKSPPQGLNYATVHKTRENNRVVKVETRVIFGSKTSIAKALKRSAVSVKVNTVFVERQNGTDRNRNGRKVRKTYCFSKDWEVHEAVTSFTMYSYNFCWPVRTLRQRDEEGHWRPRTPAMAAGLTDHLWSLKEWLSCPGVQR